MEPNDQIKISELPSQLPSLSDFIAKANADGLATKITLQQLSELLGNVTGIAPSFVVSLPDGQTLGKYKNGDVVPQFSTIQEQLKDIGQEAIVQLFTEPTVSLIDNGGVFSGEVGEVLNVDLIALFTQNDAGAEIETKYFKDGAEIPSNTDTLTLTDSNTVYSCLTSYNAGTGFKTDSLGNQYPNTIQAGSVGSNTVVFIGYLPFFYGAVASKPSTSAEVTALDKILENDGNTFILNTGSTDKIFCLWLPDGKTIQSIIDLDALNADIVGSYVAEPFTTNGINGTLYTMQQGVPYDVNHRHQINII